MKKKSAALTWIIAEAKRIKRKYPKRFKKWTDYVKQASAIYARKHKRKSRVGKKKKVGAVVEVFHNGKAVGKYVGKSVNRVKKRSVPVGYIEQGAGVGKMNGMRRVENPREIAAKKIVVLENEIAIYERAIRHAQHQIFLHGKDRVTGTFFKSKIARYRKLIAACKKNIINFKRLL